MKLPDNHPCKGAHTLENLKTACLGCTQCSLRKGAQQVVFGVGPDKPKYMLIGEAPGASENSGGEPFTGRAGKLLMQLINDELKVTRNEVWVANSLKCRPPDNRDPEEEEFKQCNPWLQKQIYLIRPSVILAVGKHGLMAVRGEWEPDLRIGQEKGRVGTLRWNDYSVPYVACYHPAYALRNPAAIDSIRKDMQLARTLLGGSAAADVNDITMW